MINDYIVLHIIIYIVHLMVMISSFSLLTSVLCLSAEPPGMSNRL